MESRSTTIKIERKTKSRIDKLKSYKRETYDDILQKVLEALNICRINPESARARLVAIDRQNRKLRRKSIKRKGVISKITTLQNKMNQET